MIVCREGDDISNDAMKSKALEWWYVVRRDHIDTRTEKIIYDCGGGYSEGA